MAVIITPNGEKNKLSPKKDFFTLYEISIILGGLIDVSFVGDKWVFVNKLAHKKGMEYNETASVIFDYPIAGLCLVADEHELPPQFFSPNRDDMDEIDEMMRERYGSQHDEEDYDEENNELESNEDSKIENDIINEANYLLFETGKTFDEILKNFIVYRRGNNTINYTGDIKKQMEILDIMMYHFIKLEEYEKCGNISKLLEIIKK